MIQTFRGSRGLPELSEAMGREKMATSEFRTTQVFSVASPICEEVNTLF